MKTFCKYFKPKSLVYFRRLSTLSEHTLIASNAVLTIDASSSAKRSKIKFAYCDNSCATGSDSRDSKSCAKRLTEIRRIWGFGWFKPENKPVSDWSCWNLIYLIYISGNSSVKYHKFTETVAAVKARSCSASTVDESEHSAKIISSVASKITAFLQ